MSKSRLRERLHADTPVTTALPPAGAKPGCSCRNLIRPPPTVPRPATPTRQVLLAMLLRRLLVVGPRQDLVGVGQELAAVAGRLADAVLVLHQAHAHIALAELAEAHARGHGHAGLLD